VADPVNPLVGFRGMRLTWAGRPASKVATASACFGESLTPAISVHSKKMRRLVRVA
jgi:hypothetical protein